MKYDERTLKLCIKDPTLKKLLGPKLLSSLDFSKNVKILTKLSDKNVFITELIQYLVSSKPLRCYAWYVVCYLVHWYLGYYWVLTEG